MLITFSGIDCSGKSTQIQLLQETLKKQGIPVDTFWYRPGYSPELDSLRRLIRRLRPSALPSTAQPKARDQLFSKPSVRRSWTRLALFDTCLQLGIKIRARLALGHTVLCDRYFHDALLDLRLRFPELEPEQRRLAALVQKMIPEPDCMILLTLSEQEMLTRMQLKREPFPDSPAVRELRYQAYLMMARDPKFSTIDAFGTPEDVHAQVMQRLPLLQTAHR